MAVSFDLIQKAGSWFSMDGERIGQGKDNVKKYLMENPEIAEELEEKIREKLYAAKNNAPAAPAQPAGRAVDVSADDFNDED